jgi:ElaB/YqjD/DUF883 family membrane-anchored ribosome-binding protein
MASVMAETTSTSNGSTQGIEGKMANLEKRLERMSHEAGEKLGEMVSEVKGSAVDSVEKSREYVQDHPGKSVAIAAAAGLVAGALLSYALRRKS